MKRFSTIIFSVLMALLMFPALAAGEDTSTKPERNYVAEGNKLFTEGKYAEAEVLYRKALEANPTSEAAQFNIGSALLRQARAAQGESDESKKLLQDAVSIMQFLAKDAKNPAIREKACYNLGNINFNNNDFDAAIEAYKRTLRLNPDNNEARENLRLAQLKKKEQEQNQDKNKDQNQDKDKKDQNQDKDKKDQDNKDQQNQDQDKKDQDQKDQPQQPQPQGGISDQNAAKILKAMENEENATRQRINARQQQAAPRRATHGNPW